MSAERNSGNFELHIEELVLHGFARGDRQRIGEALRLELLRLLMERGIADAVLQQDRTARLDAGAFELQPGTGPEQTGLRVAQTVFGAVTGERPRGRGYHESNPGSAATPPASGSRLR